MVDPYRQKVHLEPDKGFLNDPNGLVHFKGSFYVFHQWNRMACDRSYKEWGLFTSKDLAFWERRGTAIVPDTLFDKDGVYSGSAFVESDCLHIFYTGNSRDDLGKRTPYQCHCVSKDAKTFLKMTNPLLPPNGYSEHFRDPMVFKRSGAWWMIVGAQDCADNGNIAVFRSSDLNKWDFKGNMLEQPLDNMCECPGLQRIGDVDVLIASPQRKEVRDGELKVVSRRSCYCIGKFNDLEARFQPSSPMIPLDLGPDYYAPQMMRVEDGRVLMLAWMSGMTQEDEKACPTVHNGYIHCLTFPRELTLENGRLYQKPVDEISLLRCSEEIELSEGTYSHIPDACELIWNCTSPETDKSIEIGGLCSMHFKSGAEELVVERLAVEGNKRWSKTLSLKSVTSLRMIWDISSIELFLNDGSIVLSMRAYSTLERKLRATGINSNDSCICYKLKSIYGSGASYEE